MKVLNLRCAHDHDFEGWFASEEDFRNQMERGLLSCPLCDDKRISRLPSAPRLNLTTSRGSAPAPAPSAPAAPPPPPPSMQVMWLNAVRHVMANTEDVGERFVEEARRIHHGEAEVRGIRGQATPEEAKALEEEGIEVAALPLPKGFTGPLQ
jgi:hypothetical protein